MLAAHHRLFKKGTNTVANKHLAIYLNDHLAASTGALDLMKHLAEAHDGTPVAELALQLHAEISAERQELEQLIKQLGFGESIPRQVGAWLGTKIGQLKLQIDDKATGALHLFEGLEALTIGIHGKHGLWRVLGELAESNPKLRGPNYQQLVQASEDQQQRVETMRLAAAPAAFEPIDQ